MSKKVIQIGVEGNDATGDPIREAFDKVNSNFNELYGYIPGGDGGIPFTALSDYDTSRENQLVANSIFIVNNSHDTILAKTLYSSDASIAIDVATDPDRINFTSTGSKLSNDASPKLRTHLDANQQAIFNLKDPTTPGEVGLETLDSVAISRGYANTNFVNVSGDTMTGHLNAISGATGTQIPQVQEVITRGGSTANRTMTAPLILSDHPGDIAGLGSPNGDDDLQAATKLYVDTTAFASQINLYVSTSGNDFRYEVPESKRGTAFAYAFKTINQACFKAGQIIDNAPNELGPYQKPIFYGTNNESISYPIDIARVGISDSYTLEIRNAGGYGTTMRGKDNNPASTDIRPGLLIRGTVSGATVVIDVIGAVGAASEQFTVRYVAFGADGVTPIQFITGDGIITTAGEPLEYGEAVKTPNVTIYVESGEYYENLPIRIPNNVSLVGDDLRRVIVRPRTGPSSSIWSNLKFRRDVTIDGLNVLTLTTAGKFVVGSKYIVASLGTTNFVTIGAAASGVVTGSITGSLLTVTGMTSGMVKVGAYITGGTIPDGTYIVSNDTGTGVEGRYNLNRSVTQGSTTITLQPLVGTVFTATGVGTGTGTANFYEPYGYHYLSNPTRSLYSGTINSPGKKLNAQKILHANRSFIQDEMIAYIDYTYSINCTQTVGSTTDKITLANVNNLYVGMPIKFSPTTIVTATTVSNYGVVTLSSVNNLSIGQVITFAGKEFGGLIRSTSYYIIDIDTNTSKVTISLSSGGVFFPTTPATGGTMIATITQSATLGGVVAGTTYYVKEIDSGANTIKISATATGNSFDLTSSTGSMTLKWVYDSVLCKRDVGSIVDALGFDLIYGGYSKSIEAAMSFFMNASALKVVTEQLTKTIDSIEHIKYLAESVMAKIDIPTLYSNTTNTQRRTFAYSAEAADPGNGIPSVNTIVDSLVTFMKAILNQDSSVNFPRNNNDMDMFMLNDSNRIRTLSGQGHGGFMCVLDPTGQILTKSPYIQQCSSFARSIGKQHFAGGVFVDAFTGNLPATITDRNYDAGNKVTTVTVSGLYRNPQTPTAFVVSGVRFQIDYVDYNTNGTAVLHLNPTTYDAQGYTRFITVPLSAPVTASAGDRIVQAGTFAAGTLYKSVTNSNTIILKNVTGALNNSGILSSNGTSLSVSPSASSFSSYELTNPTNTTSIEIQTAGNRSMLASDFTQINDLGYGIFVTNNAFFEAVSIFCYYNYRAFYALNGAQIRSLNGSCGYGVYALNSEGADPTEVPTPAVLKYPMVQILETYSTGNLLNKRGALLVYVYVDTSDTRQYTPFNVSELEVEHGGAISTLTSAILSSTPAPFAITLTSTAAFGSNGIIKIDSEYLAFNANETATNTLSISNRALNSSVAAAHSISPAATVEEMKSISRYEISSATLTGAGGSMIGATAMVAGTSYTIAVVGTTLWTSYGASVNTQGTIFVATGPGTGSGQVMVSTLATALVEGTTYTITFQGTTTWTNYGASSNAVGTVFTATGAGTGSGQATNTKLGYVLNISTAGNNNKATGLDGTITSGTKVILRNLQNFEFLHLPTITPTRPSTALQFLGDSTIYHVLSYDAKVADNGPGDGDLAAVIAIGESYAYVNINPTTDAGTGGVPGDQNDTSMKIIQSESGSRMVGMIFAWGTKIHSITGYTLTSGDPTTATITFTTVGGTGGLSKSVAKSIYGGSSPTLKAGLAGDVTAELTVQISVMRATGHDLVDIGTGSYADSNIPSNIYGGPSNTKDQSKEVQEVGKGRVFYATTDQDGNVRFGKYFRVDQGTGTVTFSASIALSNLTGIGFKRGVTVAEFSTDDTMTNNATDTVPVQSAITGYINKRLGLTTTPQGVSSATSNAIGPGFMPRNGSLSATGVMDMGENRITRLSDPTLDQDAATKRYVKTYFKRSGGERRGIKTFRMGGADEFYPLVNNPTKLLIYSVDRTSNKATIVVTDDSDDTNSLKEIPHGLSVGSRFTISSLTTDLHSFEVTNGTVTEVPNYYTFCYASTGINITDNPTSSYVDTTSNIDMNGGKITNLVYPSDSSDAANKQYVIDLVATKDQLSELNDVSISDIKNNNVFGYNSASSKWVNAITTGDVTTAFSGYTGSAVGFFATNTIGAGKIVNSMVSSSAAIAQSKLAMTAASTRANATDIAQSDRGLASFDSNFFTADTGWISIKSNGITLSKLATMGNRTVIGNKEAGSVTPQAISHANVVEGALTVSIANPTPSNGALIRTNADTFTTLNYTNLDTASTLVYRDASKNFSAGTITANLTGNADTATTLKTTRTIQGVSFNGSDNITVVTEGTGVTVSGTVVSIGQAVATSSDVTFNKVTTKTLYGGDTNNTGVIQGLWTLTTGSTLQSTYADLAEYYISDNTYEFGTVMMIGGTSEVTIAKGQGTTAVAGVISKNPAFIMNEACSGRKLPIALQGRVPCRVVGNINKGDLLVVSMVPGVAMASTDPKAGSIIGKALGSYSSSRVGLIEVLVGKH